MTAHLLNAWSAKDSPAVRPIDAGMPFAERPEQTPEEIEARLRAGIR